MYMYIIKFQYMTSHGMNKSITELELIIGVHVIDTQVILTFPTEHVNAITIKKAHLRHSQTSNLQDS